MMANELLGLLHSEIPMSKYMGISDLKVTRDQAELRVPLAPSRNHKGTLFGGSLFSAAALACYGLFLYGIRAEGITSNDIVISEGQMKYLLPVKGDSVVRARWSSVDDRERFFKTLIAKHKARVTILAEIEFNGEVCAQFSAFFVCHAPQEHD